MPRPDAHGPVTRATTPGIDRRSLLKAAGCTVAALSLTGCSQADDGGTNGTPSGSSPTETTTQTTPTVGSRPTYADWIAASELPESTDGSGEQYGVIRADMRYLADLDGGEGGTLQTPTPGSEGDGAGELLLAPLLGTLAFAFVAGFGLIPYGEFGQSMLGGTDDSSHEVEAGLLLGETLVFTGTFDPIDTDELDGFEATDTRGGFQLYEGVDSEETFFDRVGLAFAVREDLVILALPESDSTDASTATQTPTPTPAADEPSRGRDLVERRIEVIRGEATRAVDARAEFDWVLRAGGTEAFVLAGYGREQVTPKAVEETNEQQDEMTTELANLEGILEDAVMFASSMSLQADASQADVAFGVVFDSAAATPPQSAFEPLGSGATDASITMDGHRVAIDARWDGLDMLDESSTNA